MDLDFSHFIDKKISDKLEGINRRYFMNTSYINRGPNGGKHWRRFNRTKNSWEILKYDNFSTTSKIRHHHIKNYFKNNNTSQINNNFLLTINNRYHNKSKPHRPLPPIVTPRRTFRTRTYYEVQSTKITENPVVTTTTTTLDTNWSWSSIPETPITTTTIIAPAWSWPTQDPVTTTESIPSNWSLETSTPTPTEPPKLSTEFDTVPTESTTRVIEDIVSTTITPTSEPIKGD